jgi:transcriptional regulator with XRE-family HTH domain
MAEDKFQAGFLTRKEFAERHEDWDRDQHEKRRALDDFIKDMPWYMLKALRRAQNAGQSEIATEIGVSVPQYSKYENGHLKPNLEVALRIASFFGKQGLTDLQVALHDELEKIQQQHKQVHHLKADPGSFKFHASAKATVDQSQMLFYSKVEESALFPQEESVQITDKNPVLVPRPPILSGVENAYALIAPNHHMHPRYSEGDIVYVNPKIKPSEGDDVVITLAFGKQKIAILREVWKYKTERLAMDAEYEHYEFVSWAQRDWSKMEAGFKFSSLKEFPQLIEESLKILQKSIFTLTDVTTGTVLVAGAEKDHATITEFQVHVIVGCERKRESQTAASGYGAGTFGEGSFGG